MTSCLCAWYEYCDICKPKIIKTKYKLNVFPESILIVDNNNGLVKKQYKTTDRENK